MPGRFACSCHEETLMELERYLFRMPEASVNLIPEYSSGKVHIRSIFYVVLFLSIIYVMKEEKSTTKDKL